MAGAGLATRAEQVLADVREGMSRPQKELPPKYFYDQRGSELFEEITLLPEYYLTRTERALLAEWVPRWIAELRPAALVELGAGSSAKTRIVLDAMRDAGSARRYVPVDISGDFLDAAAASLREEYPSLEIQPLVADVTEAFALPADLPRPALFAFLGSTIGNFAADEAVALLARVRGAMRPGDRFLLGVDLRKDPAVIESAYNDAAGVTAEFNLNMLRVINAETGSELDPARFRHLAFYNRDDHRIEMHLVSEGAQVVTIPGAGRWELAEGETIRTEISCKHDRQSVGTMLRGAGLHVLRWATDPDTLYAILLAGA